MRVSDRVEQMKKKYSKKHILAYVLAAWDSLTEGLLDLQAQGRTSERISKFHVCGSFNDIGAVLVDLPMPVVDGHRLEFTQKWYPYYLKAAQVDGDFIACLVLLCIWLHNAVNGYNESLMVTKCQLA
jgi:hypothetical protein